ncbi:MAG: class I SAM-dependent methyltransferase [Candidatus Caenarcaniphilales bacterium]|nr:class I SAM-dependent methyltransferase [Candidatus Caenarcaniphilales bacterium]
MSNKEYDIDEAYNPFTSDEASKNYANADFLYEQSAVHSVKFLDPSSPDFDLIVDLGAGTGVSTEALFKAGAPNLHVVEPSESMISENKARLGETDVKFIRAAAENFGAHFDKNVDVVYALNCFHLFTNLKLILDQLKKSLKPGGRFVFNVSMPSFTFDELSTEEFVSVKANRDFYKALEEHSQSPLIDNTIKLFNKILAGDTLDMVNKKGLIDAFFEFGFKFDNYDEYFIEGNAQAQKVIWELVATCLITDGVERQSFLDNTKAPAKMLFRQAYFSFIVNDV